MQLQIFPDAYSRVAIKIAEHNSAKITTLLWPLDLSESPSNPPRGEDIFGWSAYKQLGDAVRQLVLNKLTQQIDCSDAKK